MFAVQRIDHVVLRVRDAQRMIAFYEQALGMKVERRLESIRLVQMRAGDSLLDLVVTEDTAIGRNMDHVCFRVEPFDPAAIRARLAPFGIEPPIYRRRVDFFTKSRAFDSSRARAEIGYAPRIGLREGIGGTLAWYREHGWI